jgi:chemotaxis protein methyltransferase CheR
MKDIGALGRFDIIFCRNVAIYFSAEDKISLFNRLERALEPAGYLLIGAMESLAGACNQFEAHRHLRSIFYQVNRRP